MNFGFSLRPTGRSKYVGFSPWLMFRRYPFHVSVFPTDHSPTKTAATKRKWKLSKLSGILFLSPLKEREEYLIEVLVFISSDYEVAKIFWHSLDNKILPKYYIWNLEDLSNVSVNGICAQCSFFSPIWNFAFFSLCAC